MPQSSPLEKLVLPREVFMRILLREGVAVSGSYNTPFWDEFVSQKANLTSSFSSRRNESGGEAGNQGKRIWHG